jgi:hypothetical protein
MNRKTPSIVGAAVGLALFLAIALLPALLYGGCAGMLLAGEIFGTPVQATFAVGGAVAGAAVGILAENPAGKAAPQATKA